MRDHPKHISILAGVYDRICRALNAHAYTSIADELEATFGTDDRILSVIR